MTEHSTPASESVHTEIGDPLNELINQVFSGTVTSMRVVSPQVLPLDVLRASMEDLNRTAPIDFWTDMGDMQVAPIVVEMGGVHTVAYFLSREHEGAPVFVIPALMPRNAIVTSVAKNIEDTSRDPIPTMVIPVSAPEGQDD